MTVKPDVNIAWAENAAPADVVDPGDVKVGDGWASTDVPPHHTFNFEQNRQSQFNKHVNEEGIPVWDTDTIYPINGYAKDSSNGKLYRSLVGSNQGNQPALSPAQWKLLIEIDLDLVEQPTNVDPGEGDTVTTTTPTLVGSQYRSLYGVPHQSSQFQIADDVGFTSITYDSGVIAATESHTITSPIALNATYYWRVKYIDSDSNESSYSAPTSFDIPNAVVVTPTITSPTSGTIDVGSSILVQGDAFATIGGAQTHTETTLEVATDAGFVSIEQTIVKTTGDLEQMQVVGLLLESQTYYLRLRYQGSVTGYSGNSATVNFTTKAAFADWANWDGTADGSETSLPTSTTTPNQDHASQLIKIEGTDKVVGSYRSSGGAEGALSIGTVTGSSISWSAVQNSFGSLTLRTVAAAKTKDGEVAIMGTISTNTMRIYRVDITGATPVLVGSSHNLTVTGMASTGTQSGAAINVGDDLLVYFEADTNFAATTGDGLRAVLIDTSTTVPTAGSVIAVGGGAATSYGHTRARRVDANTVAANYGSYISFWDVSGGGLSLISSQNVRIQQNGRASFDVIGDKIAYTFTDSANLQTKIKILRNIGGYTYVEDAEFAMTTTFSDDASNDVIAVSATEVLFCAGDVNTDLELAVVDVGTGIEQKYTSVFKYTFGTWNYQPSLLSLDDNTVVLLSGDQSPNTISSVVIKDA